MSAFESDKYAELFTRLEKATTALESIVQRNKGFDEDLEETISIPTNHTIGGSSNPNVIADTTSKVVLKESSASSKGFHDFLELYVDPFVSLSQEMNDLVGEEASKLSRAFHFQSALIKAAGQSKKPDFSDPEVAKLLAPLQESISEIIAFKDENRGSEFFAHLNAISEGTGVLSWFLTETPISFIPEIKESATFWTNKVLKEFKEKDSRHAEWVKQYLGLFDGLKLYVKQFHTTGFTWNEDGGDLAVNLKEEVGGTSTEATIASPAPSSGGPPPPPPPPPADLYEKSDEIVSSAPEPTGVGALFSELNQGEGITKSLKKVDRSQMTHKNPELRASSIVRSTSSSSQSSSNSKKRPPVPRKPNSLSLKPKSEPVVELNDNKWIIKNVEGNHDIKIDTELSHSVFIADSKDATIQIKGKFNAVSLSSTTKVAVVLESGISGISVINSKRFGIQVLGFVPQISIDKSDEGSIYLSKTSLETEIYTTCTTGLNINVPDDELDGDFKEVNVPEQFKFNFKEGKLIGEVVEHAG